MESKTWQQKCETVQLNIENTNRMQVTKYTDEIEQWRRKY